jgi:type IV pilus assembly protein PilN
VIRVNLLPQKRRKPAASRSDMWLGATLLLVALEVVGCFIWYGSKQDEFEQQQSKNRALQAQIEQIRDVSKNHEDVKKQLVVLRDREQAIAKLQSARTGPTAMLLEVARMLTPGRGPSVDPSALTQLRRNNPGQDFNATWDSRRLWLVRFVESGRTVRLEAVELRTSRRQMQCACRTLESFRPDTAIDSFEPRQHLHDPDAARDEGQLRREIMATTRDAR